MERSGGVVGTSSAAAGYDALVARRDRLGRESRSVQIAEILRESILEGSLRPGERLSEPDICDALGVSRNTLREAFRSLVDRRLARHELNRGMFVRVPGAADVRELYACRKILEPAAVRVPHEPARLAAVQAAVSAAEACRDRDDWSGVGTADIAFHTAIVGLNGSARIDEFMAGIWDEMRLVFHLMADPSAFHGPYLERNRTILDTLLGGRSTEAADMLADYLDSAERQILGAAFT